MREEKHIQPKPRNPIPIVWLTVGDQCVQCAGVLGSWGEEARFSFRLVFTYVPRRALGRASGVAVGSPPWGCGIPYPHWRGEPWGDCNLPHRHIHARDSSQLTHAPEPPVSRSKFSTSLGGGGGPRGHPCGGEMGSHGPPQAPIFSGRFSFCAIFYLFSWEFAVLAMLSRLATACRRC